MTFPIDGKIIQMYQTTNQSMVEGEYSEGSSQNFRHRLIDWSFYDSPEDDQVMGIFTNLGYSSLYIPIQDLQPEI